MINNVSTSRQPIQFLWGALASFLAALLAGFLLFWSVSASRPSFAIETVLFGFSMLVLMLILFMRLVGRSDGDLFEIVTPMTALFILHYPVRAIFIVVWPELARLPLNWPNGNDYYIFQGLLISFGGLLVFYLGYFWKPKDRLNRFSPKISFRDGTEQLLRIKICIIYSVGIIAFIMLFRGGNAMRFVWDAQQIGGAGVQFWLLLTTFRFFGLLIAWAAWNRGRTYQMLGLAFLIINIVIGIATGSKNDIFQSILAVLLALHYVQRVGRRRIFWISVLLVGAFLGLLFPLVQNYRQSYLAMMGSNPNMEIGDFIKVASSTYLLATGSSDGLLGQSTVVEVLNRAGWFNAAVMIRWRVPEYIDYQGGSTFYPLVIGWIPRAIWPDKPTLNQGSYMHNVIIGSTTQSNVGLTSIGDFYLNFGIIGVVIGMFALGMLIRLIYLYAQSFSDVAIYKSLLYFAIYPGLLLSLQSSVATALLGMVRTVLVILVVIAFLSLGTSAADRRSTGRQQVAI